MFSTISECNYISLDSLQIVVYMKPKFLNRGVIVKYLIVFSAVIIAASFLLISNRIAKDLAREERQKIQLWAHAVIDVTSGEENTDLSLALKILASNKSVPVILCDENDNVETFVNIEIPEDTTAFLKAEIARFKKEKTPIIIENSDFRQYVYYGDSIVLKRLQLFPLIQIGVLIVFILISFMAVLSAKNAEQNKLFVGFSKEAAHQLGTPISSMLAWIEYLRLKEQDSVVLNEMEKDIQRLQVITERFSKIGSKTPPELRELREEVKLSVAYLDKRISKKVSIFFDFPDEPVYVNLVPMLFSWVIENLTKNAVDAMEGKGTILFGIILKGDSVYLDVSDSGKGIQKSKFKEVFKTGFTTKERGWGLGLSLVKRIMEDYHNGRIYVKRSEINVGTTFRIELNAAHKA